MIWPWIPARKLWFLYELDGERTEETMKDDEATIEEAAEYHSFLADMVPYVLGMILPSADDDNDDDNDESDDDEVVVPELIFMGDSGTVGSSIFHVANNTIISSANIGIPVQRNHQVLYSEGLFSLEH